MPFYQPQGWLSKSDEWAWTLRPWEFCLSTLFSLHWTGPLTCKQGHNLTFYQTMEGTLKVFNPPSPGRYRSCSVKFITKIRCIIRYQDRGSQWPIGFADHFVAWATNLLSRISGKATAIHPLKHPSAPCGAGKWKSKRRSSVVGINYQDHLQQLGWSGWEFSKSWW